MSQSMTYHNDITELLLWVLGIYGGIALSIIGGCFAYAKGAGKEKWSTIMKEVDTRAKYFGKSLLLHGKGVHHEDPERR
jgi:hypothetical protein